MLWFSINSPTYTWVIYWKRKALVIHKKSYTYCVGLVMDNQVDMRIVQMYINIRQSTELRGRVIQRFN